MKSIVIDDREQYNRLVRFVEMFLPERVKDIASVQGASATPLIGYGLVVGLNKTGDRR